MTCNIHVRSDGCGKETKFFLNCVMNSRNLGQYTLTIYNMKLILLLMPGYRERMIITKGEYKDQYSILEIIGRNEVTNNNLSHRVYTRGLWYLLKMKKIKRKKNKIWNCEFTVQKL